MTRNRVPARMRWYVPAIVLLAAGCGQKTWDSPESVLQAARESLLAPEHQARIVSLRTMADCEGPARKYTTETHSAADGRALIRQDHPQGAWFRAYVEGDGGTLHDSESASPRPIDAKWTAFVHGHEFHFAALAPDARHEGIRVEPETMFGGEEAVALHWIDDLGGQNRSFYRRDDALPLGLELTNHMGGPPLVTVRFSDWRTVDGNRLFWVATITNGANEFQFRFTTVEINPPLDTLFPEEDSQS